MVVSSQQYATQKINLISRRTMISLISGIVPLLSGCVTTNLYNSGEKSFYIEHVDESEISEDTTIVEFESSEFSDMDELENALMTASEQESYINYPISDEVADEFRRRAQDIHRTENYAGVVFRYDTNLYAVAVEGPT